MRLITSKLPFVLAIQLVAATDTCTSDDDCIGSNYNCNLVWSECFCDVGFGPMPDNNGNCADTDECDYGSVCDPNALCTNTVGSYTCECNPG